MKRIILTDDDISMLTSGIELTAVDENGTEIQVTTEAIHNRRTAIEELRDILIHCGAVSVTPGVQKLDLPGIPWGGYLCRDSEAEVTIDFSKLAEAAYTYFEGDQS